MVKKIFNVITLISSLLCFSCGKGNSNDINSNISNFSNSNTSSISEVKKLTIKFETNGATLIEDKTYSYGEEVDLSTIIPTKVGYKFVGWYLDKELTTLSSIKFKVTENITLYAKFTYNGVVVTYSVQGEIYTKETYDKGSIIKAVDAPTKVGYKFTKWTSENVDFDIDKPLYEDVTLTADYSIDELELPYIEINTENNAEITSKENYISTTINIGNTEDSEYDMEEVSAKIKGRGNSTWGQEKNPYKIKFDEKQSLLGSTYKAKKWVLLANYFDKSLSRNTAAFKISRIMEHIAFSPSSYYVDVYINGEYQGVYLLTDQVESGSGRVEIDESAATDGNTGYLLELEQRLEESATSDDIYFSCNGGIVEEAYYQNDKYYFEVKTPDSDDESFIANRNTYINYISKYMNQCFTALNGTDYNAVKNLIDVDTFAETYIIQELFANIDVGFSSFFLVKDKDGKLQAGPIWDFDLTAGNLDYGMSDIDDEDYPCPADSYLWAKNNNVFYSRLLKYQEFEELVTDYLWQYEEELSDIIEELNSTSTTGIYLKYKNSLERNFLKWDIMDDDLGLLPDYIVELKSVSEHLDFLSTWLKTRLNFIKNSYSKS